ncbi:MAG: hypothetical protein K2G14_06750, partial [Ruminococcus sp.]|nr:hypothetical protein [Ruminococcus sp.]
LNSLKGEKGDKGDTGSASVDTEKIEEKLAELTTLAHNHKNKEFLDDIETTLISRIHVLSASLSAVDDEQWRHIDSLETDTHTHENKNFLDTLTEQHLAEKYVLRTVYNRDLQDLHENIQGEHTTFRTEITNLKSEIGTIKTVFADIVEVTE